ncbi:hypothetical protein BDD12DRAFT_881935 [Trichophaea hybrida]|nr:hypothetical protein BDD12DRAFT_881935 [Trichophaea hybrida]
MSSMYSGETKSGGVMEEEDDKDEEEEEEEEEEKERGVGSERLKLKTKKLGRRLRYAAEDEMRGSLATTPSLGTSRKSGATVHALVAAAQGRFVVQLRLALKGETMCINRATAYRGTFDEQSVVGLGWIGLGWWTTPSIHSLIHSWASNFRYG